MFIGPLTEEEKGLLADYLYDEKKDREMEEKIYRADNEAWLIVCEWLEAEADNEELAAELHGEEIWDRCVARFGERCAAGIFRSKEVWDDYRLMYPDVFK
jgi:hypothetical protein